MKPLIGITSYFVEAVELKTNRPRGGYDQDLIVATADYSKGIEMAGGIPVILPYTQDKSSIRAYIEKIDGLLLSGGEDVHPSYFNQMIQKGLGHCAPHRDAFEWSLLEEALVQNKPILGICRGLQLINIYYGGTLFQDLNKMSFTDIEHNCMMVPKYVPCHEVEIYVDTRLFTMVQEGKINVNSRHHQSIDVLGQGLVVSSKSMDGVIEGIEDPNRPFLVAVQWHPEMMAQTDTLQSSIFNGFVRYCKK